MQYLLVTVDDYCNFPLFSSHDAWLIGILARDFVIRMADIRRIYGWNRFCPDSFPLAHYWSEMAADQ